MADANFNLAPASSMTSLTASPTATSTTPIRRFIRRDSPSLSEDGAGTPSAPVSCITHTSSILQDFLGNILDGFFGILKEMFSIFLGEICQGFFRNIRWNSFEGFSGFLRIFFLYFLRFLDNFLYNFQIIFRSFFKDIFQGFFGIIKRFLVIFWGFSDNFWIIFG